SAIGVPSRSVSARYGSNASIFGAAGIPSVVFGPGSIEQAHTCDEWIDLSQVRQAADVLIGVARNVAVGAARRSAP
ncbi:MAG: M20/M25/M40 family metallo-hydrolase, partial [Planctomycetaceae bacterium]